MSKKCCGMIYADEDTICKICGKPLTEEVNPEQEADSDKDAVEYSKLKEETDKVVADVLRMQEETEKNAEAGTDTALAGEEETAEAVSAADEDAAEEEGEKVSVRQPGRAPGGMKAAGILAIIAAALGMAAIVLSIIFFVLFPEYSKRGNADMQMNFPEIATETDAIAQRPVLTPTDVEINESFDASTTATETDAQASETDAEEAE